MFFINLGDRDMTLWEGSYLLTFFRITTICAHKIDALQ